MKIFVGKHSVEASLPFLKAIGCSSTGTFANLRNMYNARDGCDSKS